jgi:hypothetical protein
VSLKNTTLLLVTGLLALTICLPVPAPQARAQEQPNLLVNPGFDEGWYDVVIGQVPDGWHWLWLDNTVQPGTDIMVYAPETRVMPRGQIPPSEQSIFLRDGDQCVKVFKPHSPIYAALMQNVNGLEVGRTYQLVAPVFVDTFDWEGKKVPPGDPYTARVRLGAGPKGASWLDEGAINYSGWWDGANMSPFYLAYSVPTFEFVATQPDMAVYVELAVKWGLDNNGFFLDGMALYPGELLHTPTPTAAPPPPPPPPPTAGPSPTPRPTPTPRPDGAIVHIVESGDTIFGIALMYGVDPDQIRQLNAGSIDGDIIQVGQALVISIPSEAPNTTPTPQPDQPAPGAAPNPENSPSGEGTTGASICVLAYHDRNGDKFRDQATEELLPNAEITLADASGVIGQYPTNGIDEPYCFTGLAAGFYRIIQNSPPGYAPSGSAERDAAVAEGTTLDIPFGNVRDESADGSDDAAGSTTTGEQEGGGGTSIFSTLAKISGVLVLVLAAGMAVLFVVNRQRT